MGTEILSSALFICWNGVLAICFGQLKYNSSNYHKPETIPHRQFASLHFFFGD